MCFQENNIRHGFNLKQALYTMFINKNTLFDFHSVFTPEKHAEVACNCLSTGS